MAKKVPGHAPVVNWTDKEKKQAQEFFDRIEGSLPDIAHEEPGFADHNLFSPRDPGLVTTEDERKDPRQVREPGHEEQQGTGEAGFAEITPQDLEAWIHQAYDPTGKTGGKPILNSRPVGEMPRTGALINRPVGGLPAGPLIHVPVGGKLPTSLINQPLFGGNTGPLITSQGAGLPNLLINKPVGEKKVTVADILKLKAQLQAKAHGYDKLVA